MNNMNLKLDENDSYLKPGMKDEKEPKGVKHGMTSKKVSKKSAMMKFLAKKKK